MKVFYEDEWIRLDELSLDNECEKLYLDVIFTESGQVMNVNTALRVPLGDCSVMELQERTSHIFCKFFFTVV